MGTRGTEELQLLLDTLPRTGRERENYSGLSLLLGSLPQCLQLAWPSGKGGQGAWEMSPAGASPLEYRQEERKVKEGKMPSTVPWKGSFLIVPTQVPESHPICPGVSDPPLAWGPQLQMAQLRLFPCSKIGGWLWCKLQQRQGLAARAHSLWESRKGKKIGEEAQFLFLLMRLPHSQAWGPGAGWEGWL